METKNTLIAKRYSDALFDPKDAGNIYSQLYGVKEVLTANPDFFQILLNPTLESSLKNSLISDIFKDSIDLKLLNFLKLLIDNKRFSCFDQVVENFHSLIDEANNMVRIEVTSAIEVDEDLKDELKNKMQTKINKKVDIQYNIDSKIMAGLIIKIGDRIIDTSLKTRLEKLEKQLA